MPFDFKKEYKKFYRPPRKPVIVEIPEMNFLAVKGKGNPYEEMGEYKVAVGLLYTIAYTIKMSYKGNYKIDGYYQYVVPPLEGLWWQTGTNGIDYKNKDRFHWISLLRLPDFIAREDFEWAIKEATKKKKDDFSKVDFFTHSEGLCVQCMHIGPYDNEPITISRMNDYIEQNGYISDITDKRHHHEIYLSDPRKGDLSKLKTVIREPIKRI
ncbi:MAG TPA: GyrI-like domain-containing protein [Atribacterota bacterium]|nr:GyrI-like domain-containing protein [Atribacterota bacterium]